MTSEVRSLHTAVVDPSFVIARADLVARSLNLPCTCSGEVRSLVEAVEPLQRDPVRRVGSRGQMCQESSSSDGEQQL